MKALSVRAPWWHAILSLGKDIENRTRYSSFRGTIYIHASKWWSTAGVRDEWKWGVGPMARAASPQQPRPELTDALEAQMKAAGGCLVGKVDIVGCMMSHKSPWFRGKFGLILANPVALAEPIPFIGMLGLFEVPDGIEHTWREFEAPDVAWKAEGKPLFSGFDLGESRDFIAPAKGGE